MESAQPEAPRRYDEIAPRPPERGPIDLQGLLPGDGPIELDIGFGRGHSIFSRAEASPTSRILGVEIKTKWAFKVDERRIRLKLDRVRVWAADVRPLLGRLGPDACIQRVFVHFPDPWWKKRHQKRRVVGAPLLDELARLMCPGGDLYIQTDVRDRHALYVDVVEAHAAFDVVDSELDHNPFGAISNRERRAVEDGLPIHRLLARRSV